MSELNTITPLWIVADLKASVRFYMEVLDFELRMQAPQDEPFFAIVGKDSISLMLKQIDDQVLPQPNASRHPWAKWDAFIHLSDPVTYAEECTQRSSEPIKAEQTEDGLFGFEISDADGYTLFFGHPAS